MGMSTSALRAMQLLGLLLLSAPFASVAQPLEEAGEVVLVRGIATAQTLDGQGRVVGPGSSFKPGEYLRTAKGTFAVIRFADDTKMTLRPATTLEVESFEYAGPNDLNARANLFLHAGGVRIDTGRVAALNPDRFELATPTGA